MTRQGRSPGYKPRTTGGARTDSNALPSTANATEEMRVKAAWYLVRTGNRDLLEVLGLVDDPVAAARRRQKALVDMGSRPWSKRGEKK